MPSVSSGQTGIEGIYRAPTPWPLTVFERLDSTNSEVKRRLKAAAPPPFAVMAYVQTAGYGRQGRLWESPFGGLYLSLTYRPEAKPSLWPTLCLVTALATRDAICARYPAIGAALRVKWPNDLVVLSDKGLAKLCGISTETCAGALCIGIGVNVAPVHGQAIAGLTAYPAAFLLADDESESAQNSEEQRLRDRISELARQVVSACKKAFAIWESRGLAAFVDDYNAYSLVAGRRITVADIEGKHEVTGVAGAVTADGSLELVDDEGAMHHLVSGEVHIQESLYSR